MNTDVVTENLDETQRARVVALGVAAEIGKGRGALTAGQTKFDSFDLIRLAEFIVTGDNGLTDLSVETEPEYVILRRSTASFAATALAGSSDNGDQYCARQIREALGEVEDADLPPEAFHG